MPPSRSINPTIEDIEKERRLYELRQASRARHPELVVTRRPTVEELLQRAACARHSLEELFQRAACARHPFDRNMRKDLADLFKFTRLEAEDPIFFKHRVGDGFHYINKNALILPSGKKQPGDTSEGCILTNIALISLETIAELWNRAYPEDSMAVKEMVYLIFTGMPYCEAFDADSPENIQAAVQDLYAIGCDRMAEILLKELRGEGR